MSHHMFPTMNALFPNLANSREIQELRQLKRAGGDLQAAVNACVREGCSVELMQKNLKKAGCTPAEIDTLISTAYPAASE